MTTRFYSLKRPSGWFWSNWYRLEEVRASNRDGEIGNDWKICRDGHQEFVVTVAEFLEDPTAFDEESDRIEQANHAKRIQQAEEAERARQAKKDEQARRKAARAQEKLERIPKKECPDCGGVMRAIKIVAGGIG